MEILAGLQGPSGHVRGQKGRKRGEPTTLDPGQEAETATLDHTSNRRYRPFLPQGKVGELVGVSTVQRHARRAPDCDHLSSLHLTALGER